MKPAIAIVVAALLLVSCVTIKPPIKVSRGPGWYTVKVSDTLYSIAWRYGLDYKQLARWNGIDVNSPIHPGQRLRLIKPVGQGTVTTRPSQPIGETETEPGASATVRSENFSSRDPQKWLWPTQGRTLNTFLASQLDRRGIDIAGQLGQAVHAVADGKVVYSGNGLAGYGNLVIIKHSETFLSAYAYCQERLVEEGKLVKAGKLIGENGTKGQYGKTAFRN